MPFPVPSPTYVGPAKFHGGSTNQPIHRIVIHGTVSPCESGGARNVARYFRETVTKPSSAHYIVDPGETVQVVFDDIVAYHAPPNEHSLGIELCDPQVGSAARWNDQNHRRMLVRASRLVAQLCLAYGVRIRKIGPADLIAGKEGVCGHIDVTNAWHQSTHVDPGESFPWSSFMALVHAEADDIIAAATPDVPTRITKFRDAAQVLIAQYLDPAVDAGRTGTVEHVRDEIRHQLTLLPDR